MLGSSAIWYLKLRAGGSAVVAMRTRANSVISKRHYCSFYLHAWSGQRNTLWLRDTVKQTFPGKLAAAGLTTVYYMDIETSSGPLFTKWMDVLPQDLTKSRSREIVCYADRIALKFDWHLGSATAEVPVKFKSVWESLNPNLAASRLQEFMQAVRRPST